MLTTLSSVKTQAGINPSDTSQDLQLNSLINGCNDYIKRYLNRDIEQTVYSEIYSGDNSSILMLRQFPVISIQSIYQDQGAYAGQAAGSFAANTLLVQGVDWCLLPGNYGIGSSGAVRRINGTWYGRPSRVLGRVANQPTLQSGNIQVNYTAGYLPVPPGLVMGVNAMVIRGLTFSQGMIASEESYEDAHAAYFNSGEAAKFLGSVERTLGKFKMLPV